MLAHTVGQFFCMWRGFLLDEIKSEDLFKVQQQSLKGTERSESMCDLQHKQVPQQVSSAHAPTECSQITDLILKSNLKSCVLLLLVPLKMLKVSRSVTSSHRCLQAKSILLYCIKTSYSWIYFLLAWAAASLFSTFLICLTCLPFFFSFFSKLAMIFPFHASFPINFFSLIEDSIHCSHSTSSWSRVSAMSLCVHKFCIYCQLSPRFWTSICPKAKLHIHSHLSCLFLI